MGIWREKRSKACGATFSLDVALAAFVPPVPLAADHVALVGAHAAGALLRACEQGLALPAENLTCSGARSLPSPPPALARAPRTGACSACEEDAPAPAAPTGAVAPAPDPLARFLAWYAPVLLGQVPCMRMDDVSGRAGLTGGPGVRGVVYHTMKFCDYYGFEYADLCATGSGTDGGTPMPMLKIETDGTSQSAGQLRTRLEAFGEELGAQKCVKVSDTFAHSAGSGRYVVGVDSGSTSTDVALVSDDGRLAASLIVRTGAKASVAAAHAIDEMLARAGVDRSKVALFVATGYGRDAAVEQSHDGPLVIALAHHAARAGRRLALCQGIDRKSVV